MATSLLSSKRYANAPSKMLLILLSSVMAFESKTTSAARKCHTVQRCLCLGERQNQNYRRVGPFVPSVCLFGTMVPNYGWYVSACPSPYFTNTVSLSVGHRSRWLQLDHSLDLRKTREHRHQTDRLRSRKKSFNEQSPTYLSNL